METALRIARGVAASALGEKTRQAPRDVLAQAVIEATNANPDILGTWLQFAPDAYDGRDKDEIDAAHHTSDARGHVSIYAVNSGDKVELQEASASEDILTQEYFTIPFNTGQEAVVEPYVYPVDGKDVVMTSVTVPILQDGKPIGVAGVDIALDRLAETLAAIRPLGDGSTYLVSSRGAWIAGGAPEWAGKPSRTPTRSCLRRLSRRWAAAPSRLRTTRSRSGPRPTVCSHRCR
jgi:hypothetical protein